MIKKKTILVTGGAGFIGSHLCDKLLELGHQVICVDNFDNYYPPEFKQQNIENALRNPNFIFYEIDITNYEKIAPLFELYKVDVIIHLAGRGGVSPSVERPLFYVHTNVHGTLCMLEIARHYQVPQFVFASSSSVYGSDSKPPFTEDDPVLNQASPYGATKRAAELLVQTYHNLYKIRCVIFRFFTVYGPRSRPDMALNKFTEQILSGAEVSQRRGMKRDFTYVDDVIAGIVSALDKNLDYEIINLGNCTPITVREYIAAIEKALGIKAKIVIKDPLPGELLETMAAIDKGEKLLGYNPKTKIEQGVANFVKWYKANRQEKKIFSKSQKPVKVIAFDFDGTIVNIEREKARIFGKLVEAEWKGNSKDAENFYFEVSGPPRKYKFDFYYRKLFHSAIPNHEYEKVEKVFSEILKRNCYPKARVLPGALELLKFSRKIFDYVYICSGVPSSEIKQFVKIKGLNGYFDDIMGTGDRYSSKQAMFTEIHNKKNPFLMFYFTDGELGIKVAKELGITTIGITTNKSSEKLAQSGADFTCSLSETEHLLKKLLN